MTQKVANEAKRQRRGKKSSKSQNSPWNKRTLTLSMQTPPLDRHYHVSSLNHLISKSSTNFVHNLSPFTMNSSNTIWEKNEMLCMRSKLGCFTRYTSEDLSNYTQPLCQDLQKQVLILTKRDHPSMKNSASTFCAPDAPKCTACPINPTEYKNTSLA
jgi:hypothetical protein